MVFGVLCLQFYVFGGVLLCGFFKKSYICYEMREQYRKDHKDEETCY